MKKIFFLLIVFTMLLQGAFSQSIIQIDDFGVEEEHLQLLGQAKVESKYLRLTPNVQNISGASWLKSEKIDLSRGFETEFEFRVIEKNETNGIGDGFAFVIQNDAVNKIGGTGDELGYGGIKNALVLEFDTYDNGEGSSNHIDIAYYDAKTNGYRRHATVHAIPELTDGKPHFARVHYKDGFLTLFMDSYIFPVLSSKINIEKLIGAEDGKAWLGFTAATSKASACHDLMKWDLSYYLPPPDIDEESIEVNVLQEVKVNNRKIKIRVKDYNKVDGDVISLKYGDKWVLSEYKLTDEPMEISITLTGFSAELIMFANNVGTIPPNTASIVIDDGINTRQIKMEADYESSEAIRIQFEEATE